MPPGDEDDEEIPRFDSRLILPDDISPASRMFLEQLEVRRQVDEWVHRRSALGLRIAREARELSESNAESIEKFTRLCWMGAGALLLVQGILALAIVYFKISGK